MQDVLDKLGNPPMHKLKLNKTKHELEIKMGKTDFRKELLYCWEGSESIIMDLRRNLSEEYGKGKQIFGGCLRKSSLSKKQSTIALLGTAGATAEELVCH